MALASTHRDLEVFRISFDTAMELFRLSKNFPREELYSLTDQIRRSSRSVSANIAESFRKRRYKKMFISKLTDCESEAAETQVWIDFAMECGYIEKETHTCLYEKYDRIIGKIVNMINSAESWSKQYIG